MAWVIRALPVSAPTGERSFTSGLLGALSTKALLQVFYRDPASGSKIVLGFDQQAFTLAGWRQFSAFAQAAHFGAVGGRGRIKCRALGDDLGEGNDREST